MFFVLYQFSTIPQIDTDWDRAELYVLTSDLISVVDKAGVDWTDSGDVTSKINPIKPPNLLYSLKIIDSSGSTTVVHDDINNPVIVSLHKIAPNTQPAEFYEVVLTSGYLF